MHPQEIRNREFTRSIRGYNPTEVDEYIDFLADAVSLLQRENNELERKLTIAIGKLEELQEREASITRLDTEMRRAAARLLRQAETQRDHILADARAEADRILQDTEAKAALQRKLCAAMQNEIAQFKDELYNRYGQHIDQLEKIAQAAAKMSFGEADDTMAAPTAPEVVEETPAVEEIEEFEDTPAVEEIEEFEDAPAVAEI
jgi:cell division initiation protein